MTLRSGEQTARMNKTLKDWLAAIEGRRVVVWGDLVADHMVYGNTARISREAPVLILDKEWESITPGCAGNAIMNVASLGGTPVPVGAVGDDEIGKRLLAQLGDQDIDTSHVQSVAGGETAIKMRVLAGGLHTVKQQVIRIDSAGCYSDVSDAKIVESLTAALNDADGIIVSDYGLGTVRPDIFASSVRKRSIISVIDSRYSLDEFAGAVSATPNEPELEQLTRVSIGDDEEILERAARETLGGLKLEALLVTRGKKGMALFRPGEQRTDIPVAKVQDIVDVTGAGDTVIAAYTLALSAGAPFEPAARLANVAASLAVMKRGPAAPSAAEVRLGLEAGTGVE
jgi:rfaE bifunctional protein kinase chain/domain